MRKYFYFFLLVFSMFSCTSTKQVVKINNQHLKATKIVNNANKFLGTKYKFGGTTRKGMDCSGLVYTAFKQENILLPRVSRDMAMQGKTISLNQVKKGDLLFFITGKKNRISHVGLVTNIKNNEIFFIHASSKRGVIISSLNEKYYKTRFVKAKRIL